MTLNEIAFEKDFKTRFIPLSRRLTKIENQMQKVLFTSIREGRIPTVYWNRVRREVTSLYAKMNKLLAQWSETQMPRAYWRAAKHINARIQSIKSVVLIGKKGLIESLNSRASSQIVQNLYRGASENFLNAAVMGRKNLFTLIRLTQQTLIDESLIDITVAQGMEMGNLRKAANALTGQLWGELYGVAEGKQFVQAGKMRYKPNTYAELVARTKFMEAHSQAALMTASNYKTDLVQISTHNTNCEQCMDYEGKVFSVSGEDKRFPILNNIPPYHPRCLHLMYPTFVSMMEVQGTLESFSDFSKGKIDQPPIPASFIPVNQRGALLRAAGPIPKEISKVAIRPTSQTLPNLTAKKGAESVTKSFGKSPAALQNVVDKHVDFNLLMSGKNGGSYMASSSTISIGTNLKATNKFTAIRHEIGHHIDSRMGTGVVSGVRHNWSNGGEFKAALNKDVGNLLGNIKQSTALNKALNGSKMGDSSLGDLFEAATKGRVKGYFGHGMEYYRNKPDMFFGEPFANMTEIYGRSGRGGWSFLQKHLPETTRVYEQAVLGV